MLYSKSDQLAHYGPYSFHWPRLPSQMKMFKDEDSKKEKSKNIKSIW